MTDSVAEISAYKPLDSSLAEQIPVPEQRGKVSYMKKEDASLVLVEFSSLNRDATEGQIVMAKMLAKPTKESSTKNDLEPRPAGYAIAFAKEPVGGENLDRNLYESGMVVFTSPIEINGRIGFVAADKKGLFHIQEGQKVRGEDFLVSMNKTFEKVGDQEDNFFIKGDTVEAVNARYWPTTTVVPIEANDAAIAIKTASEASLKVPFVSSKDMEIVNKRMRKNESTSAEPIPTPQPHISKIEF